MNIAERLRMITDGREASTHAKCEKCGAAIIIAQTTAGKQRKLDADMHAFHEIDESVPGTPIPEGGPVIWKTSWGHTLHSLTCAQRPSRMKTAAKENA